MFEFSIAKKYLWPKRKHLSVSLIALLSVFVISLVIWLLLLFLSITEGIEKNWLNKVTSLNAPIRILPTEEYYNSYYYQVDAISSKSGYQLKSIQEKLISTVGDPYCNEEDEEVPFYWPRRVANENDTLHDLVKDTFDVVKQTGDAHNLSLLAEDYEIAGALMRLRQVRKGEAFSPQGSDSQTFLTQASYISSITEANTALYDLFESPTMKDINHLLYLADRVADDNKTTDKPVLAIETSKLADKNLMKRILSNLQINKVATNSTSWKLDPSLLMDGKKYDSFARLMGNKVLCLILPTDSNVSYHNEMTKGFVEKHGTEIVFHFNDQTYSIDPLVPIFLDQELLLEVTTPRIRIPNKITSLSDCKLQIKADLQGHQISGGINWENIEVIDAEINKTFLEEPEILPPWACFINGSIRLPQDGILLPNNFREYNVLIGDSGYFAYGSATPTSMQEQRLTIRISGFYDPGVMAVGARFALGDRSIAHHINESAQSTSLDPMLSNGIQVWFRDLKKTPIIVAELNKNLEERGLSPYWKVVPFYKYEFAKDLMSQFQSDRYLFMLIGVIILFVACSNIISLLLLLVNDKKHEIGVLLSLGAKKRSIAFIFGICGVIMGLISCVIGSIAAYFTLYNIDTLVHFLNLLEGQQAFNAVFYGSSLPSTLSKSSLIFILVTTPIVSMLAGLIPAVKACRLKPSAILRSE